MSCGEVVGVGEDGTFDGGSFRFDGGGVVVSSDVSDESEGGASCCDGVAQVVEARGVKYKIDGGTQVAAEDCGFCYDREVVVARWVAVGVRDLRAIRIIAGLAEVYELRAGCSGAIGESVVGKIELERGCGDGGRYGSCAEFKVSVLVGSFGVKNKTSQRTCANK